MIRAVARAIALAIIGTLFAFAPPPAAAALCEGPNYLDVYGEASTRHLFSQCSGSAITLRADSDWGDGFGSARRLDDDNMEGFLLWAAAGTKWCLTFFMSPGYVGEKHQYSLTGSRPNGSGIRIAPVQRFWQNRTSSHKLRRIPLREVCPSRG